jgi:insertion element IS1 protein InsB
MIVRDACPACGSTRFQKHGPTHHGQQQQQCTACPRQVVPCSEPSLRSDETRALSERVLRERISLRGSGRAVGVGLQGLMGFIVHGCEALPDHGHVQPLTCHADIMSQRLEVEADAMSRFVPQQANQPWIGLAMETTTRHIMAFHSGDRRRKRARRLWAKMPEAYRQQAMLSTDQDVVYEGVMPAAQHKAIHKLARRTHHVERFNHTLRPRVSRLVRET